jgi:minor extracellular serine protease Vpr
MRRVIIGVAAVGLASVLVGTALAGATPGVSRDFTEAPAAQTQSEYVVVTLSDPLAASYEGGIPGLERTRPAPGERLNPRAEAVRAYVAHLRGAQADYRAWMASRTPRAEVVRDYALVANALAVKLNGTRAATLSQGPGVKSVTASWLYRPAMNVSNPLIGSPALWAGLGGQAAAGSGIKVGIVDTGILPTHPFFACKDEIPAKVYASGGDPPPFGLPTIVFDHGTHVAGTVAGCPLTRPEVSGVLSGVAPGAELHDYNVFPGFGAGFIAFGGSAFSHDIIAALEDGVADGMHVMNMSLGGMVQGPHDTLAEAVDATVDAGLVVAVAAGNAGPGDSTIDSPGSAAGALTAGASTNPHFIGIPVTVGADTFGAALGEFANFDPAVTADYTVTEPALGCTAISTDLTGKIALIDRGVCTFSTKVRNAQAAGAVGVLIVNNVAGDPVGMAHDGLEFPTIPAAMLGKEDGDSIKPSGTATVDGTSPQEFLTENEDIIAGFSSRGPVPFTYLIKPDVTAPGVNVYSAAFEAGEEFAFFQGTSMAAPHVAGAAALLLHANPGWSPADVKSALVTTGKRPVWDHVTGTSPTGVLTRGGGRIDLAGAADVPVTSDPAGASFGLFNGNAPANGSVDLSLRATGATAVCGVAVTGGDGRTAAPPMVTVPPEGATLTVTFTGGRAAQTPSGDYSGDVVLDCAGTELKVPWWVRVNRQGRP